MKYAIFRLSGQQYKVAEGDIINVANLKEKANDVAVFKDVLLYVSDGILKVGNPIVEKVLLKGRVLSEKKAEKIRVSKFKSKVRYRRNTGKRELFKNVKIEEISLEKEKSN